MKQVIPETVPDYDGNRIIERPDGFYWQSLDGTVEHGPFVSLLEAVQDMQFQDDIDEGVGESVEEAEDEIGISGWVDPDTGELAEDNVPRLEDH